MGKKLYLTAVERSQGKSFISLGLLAALLSESRHVRTAKLFNEANRAKLTLLEQVAGHPIPPLLPINYAINLMHTRPDELINQVLESTIAHNNNEILYFEGTDFESDNDLFEYQFNLTLASQLNCEVILVISAKDRTLNHTFAIIDNALEIAKKYHADVRGIIINRIDPIDEDTAQHRLKADYHLAYNAVVPEFSELSCPTMQDIADKLNAKVLCGKESLHRPVKQLTIAAKTIGNFLQSRNDRSGMLIITPDDRIDILLGSMLADQSANYPKIAGIVLTGGEMPFDVIREIIDGLLHPFPVLLTQHRTFETATLLHNAKFSLTPSDPSRVERALTAIRPYLMESVFQMIARDEANIEPSPAVFLYELSKKAQRHKQRIVLPEGDDPRILQAAAMLLARNVVDIILLGSADKINHLAKRLEIDIKQATIIDVLNAPEKERYAEKYYELRRHKNINMPIAIERMTDVNYFGAMMVYMGDADGMVSGANHTTADTVRPALEIIKTKKNVTRVSSIFIMCLPSRILIYGDCAINPDPDSATLAEIAIQSANMTQKLGLRPRVALLSYSSGDSGHGESVDKVKEALKIVQEQRPDLLIEGPIQYDAAVDPRVAKKKLKHSKLKGHANVLIFPDLNTGNNTYKAVQRETGALAVGPILIGLNKPVNDLSRGCSVQDIIHTILITAIAAMDEPC